MAFAWTIWTSIPTSGRCSHIVINRQEAKERDARHLLLPVRETRSTRGRITRAHSRSSRKQPHAAHSTITIINMIATSMSMDVTICNLYSEPRRKVPDVKRPYAQTLCPVEALVERLPAQAIRAQSTPMGHSANRKCGRVWELSVTVLCASRTS